MIKSLDTYTFGYSKLFSFTTPHPSSKFHSSAQLSRSRIPQLPFAHPNPELRDPYTARDQNYKELLYQLLGTLVDFFQGNTHTHTHTFVILIAC